MVVDEGVRRKAVAAVLDGGMTQRAVCLQYNLKLHWLRQWLKEEKLLRLEQAERSKQAKQVAPIVEEVRARLHALETSSADWAGIQRGLKRVDQTDFWMLKVIGVTLGLIALLLVLVVGALAFLLVLEQISRVQSWVLPTAVIVAVTLLISVLTFVVANYFSSLIYRVVAPFAYVSANLRHALFLLLNSGEEIFDRTAAREHKRVRKDLRKALGRAAHTLDVTPRLGRNHNGNGQTKEGERKAHRNVAASVAGVEDLLWHEEVRAKDAAIEIIKLALYETLLRKWTLQDPAHPPEEVLPPWWRRRMLPFLKGVGAFAFTSLPVFLEVVGVEGVTAGKVIRQVLQSRGLLPSP